MKKQTKSKTKRNINQAVRYTPVAEANTSHKTILVVYTPHQHEVSTFIGLKRYPFNTTDDLRVGDVIESSSYATPMHVVEVLPHYKYINIVTCELSNTKAASTAQREIRPLILEYTRPTNTITARLLRRTVN